MPAAHVKAAGPRTDDRSRATGERRLILLGSTGSIGTQTLETVAHLNRLADEGRWSTRYRVVGLAAGRSADALRRQALEFEVPNVAIAESDADLALGEANVFAGPDAAERLVRETDADLVLGAMVGSAGLPATLAAVELGRDVALANKETLVAAGELIVPAACASGAALLPVDSEHAALWQCLQSAPGRSAGAGEDGAGLTCAADRPAHPPLCPPCTAPAGVRRIVLTASGGPFRTWDKARIESATPREALAHPTWNMGPKVTIDCASLTNKALEVIEAHWLFGLGADRIDVLVHPQSIVHSLVEFEDGSLIAQLGPPDMRSPIQYALTFPERADGVSRKLDIATLSRLDFEQPDLERFPALGLAYDVIRAGGTAGAVFNGANEAAVEAFLAERIPFGRVPALASEALRSIGVSPLRSLQDALEADAAARDFVRACIGG